MDGDTPITISVKAAIWGAVSMIVAFAAAMYTVFQITLGNVGADVSSIKEQIAKAQDVTREVQSKGFEADTGIRDALASIDSNGKLVAAELASFKETVVKSLDGLQMAVADVNASIGKLTDQYADINVRLVKIETVLTGGGTPSPEQQPKPEQPKLEPQPLPQPQ